MLKAILALILLASHAGAQSRDWAAVERLKAQESVAVSLRGRRILRGKIDHWTPAAIHLSSPTGIEQIPRQEVSAIRVEKRGSRKKTALWGGIIGFGVAFPIGVAAAGSLTDRNNPSASTRMGMGAGLGLFGSGIRGGLGALAGGAYSVMIYRAP